MKARAIWTGILGLLMLAVVNVASNVVTLANVREIGVAGAAPEDLVGYGILPVWLTIGILLGVLLLLGRKHLRRNQVALISVALLALFIADWATHSKLLASMGL